MQFPICNKKPNRAPKLFGHPFILCWRCTGILIGGIISMMVPLSRNYLLFLFLVLPLLIDYGTQWLKWRESTNILRAITGVLCGFAGGFL